MSKVIKDIERTLRSQKSFHVRSGIPPDKSSHNIIIRAILSHEVNKIEVDSNSNIIAQASKIGMPSDNLLNDLEMPFKMFFAEFTNPVEFENHKVAGIFASKSDVDKDRINVSALLRQEDYITFKPFTINMKNFDEKHTNLVYGNLFVWMLVYMNSNGVSLTSMPVSRQIRRHHERKGIPLQRWYRMVSVFKSEQVGKCECCGAVEVPIAVYFAREIDRCETCVRFCNEFNSYTMEWECLKCNSATLQS